MRLNVLPDFGTPGSPKTAVIEIGFEDADTDVLGEATGLKLPANCLATFRPFLTEVFNSGTSDTITVGKLGALTAYLAGGDINEAAATVQAAVGPYHITAETEVYVDYQSTGTAPTTGRLFVAVDVVRLA